MAGESRDELLRREFSNEDNRLEQIMTSNPIEGKPYGMLSHLAFASTYVIIVDCSKYTEWNQEQSHLATTIRTLLKIKKAVHTDFQGKIMEPIAIIFSKFDQMLAEDKDSAKNLLKKLPEFKSTLDIAHRGKQKLFLSSVESVILPKDELDSLIEQEIKIKNTDLVKENEKIKDLDSCIKTANQEYESLQQELSELEQKLIEAQSQNNSEEIDQITQVLEEQRKKVDEGNSKYKKYIDDMNSSNANKIEIEKRLDKDKPSAEAIGISKFKPTHPLKYNVDEYLNFINWIIEMNKE